MEVKMGYQEDAKEMEEMREAIEESEDFDGWNVELKDSDDNGSGLVARPSTVPLSEPRKTLLETLRSLCDVNPALMVTVTIAPIFQIDRPYKIKYNNISDEEFREMFWSSREHEVTAICVDYDSRGVGFITGYNAFLDGIKTKSFYLMSADIDKYDIRFEEYRTANEPSLTSLIEDKAEKEN